MDKNKESQKKKKEQTESESGKRERGKGKMGFLILSKIYGNLAVGFCRRRKDDPRIENYAWVPKSSSFVKLHEVGNFPT